MKPLRKVPKDKEKSLGKLPTEVRNRMGYMKEGGKLNVSKKKVGIDPPKGYHWMEESGRYYLMEGDYKPHPGAVKKAQFKLVTHK